LSAIATCPILLLSPSSIIPYSASTDIISFLLYWLKILNYHNTTINLN
jgi:hypothetical protein